MTLDRVVASLFVLTLAGFTGCGGDSPTGNDGSSSVASVSISPGDATADALDATVEFDATALNQDGTEVGGAELSWSSTDESVASVNSNGVATAAAEGTAEIVAETEGAADTASLTVDQAVDSVAVSPSTLEFQAAGDTARVSAEAADANDHPVSDASFTWSSSDPTVATVNDEGLVTAESAGEASVAATAQGVADSSSVQVGQQPLDSPTISSVSPSPVPEGGSVTISGSNFAADATDNTVLVDGASATVTSASSSSLEITVPEYACLPARDVALEVRTSVGSDQVTNALEPAESPVSLAGGEQLVIQDPSGFCLQFDETAASERYLVGVQSLSGTPGSLTGVTITSEAADGSGAAAESPISLSVEGGRSTGGIAPRRSTRIVKHRRAELRRRVWERRNLDPRASLAARGQGATLAPSKLVGGNAQEGDTVSVRVLDLAAGDPCSSFTEIGAEVKAIGTQAIFVADTANPSGGFTDADYQDFSDQMDADIFSTLVDQFGGPTDLDGNGHVVVVISKEVNLGNPNVLGFVFGGDLFPRSSCASSDEGEFYYGKAPDPDGDFAPPYPTAQARSETPFIMAHELTHVIQQSRRFDAGQDFMSSIVAEAQATLSEEVVGHAVTGRSPGQDLGFDVAFNPDDTDAIDWYANAFIDLTGYFGFEGASSRVPDAPDACGWWRADPSPCLARSLWYGVGWSFLRWASDQFGASHPGGEEGFHRDLIGSGGVGPENVADVLGRSFEQMMARWAATLYVDDRVSGLDPRLDMTSWDLFDVEQNLVPTAHLEPLEMDFTDWQGVGEIRASSTGYVAVEQAGRPATAIRVRGGSGGTLPGDMQVWVVRLD